MPHSFSQIGGGGPFEVRQFIADLTADPLAASRQLAASSDGFYRVCGNPGGKPSGTAVVCHVKAAMNCALQGALRARILPVRMKTVRH
jgi:hypothetical protein